MTNDGGARVVDEVVADPVGSPRAGGALIAAESTPEHGHAQHVAGRPVIRVPIVQYGTATVRGRWRRMRSTAERINSGVRVMLPSGQARFSRHAAPSTAAAASASFSRCSGDPFEDSSARVKSQRPTA